MHEFEPRSAVSRLEEHCAWLSPWSCRDGISNAEPGLPAAPYCGEESPREVQTCQTSVIQASKRSCSRLPSAATITVAFTIQPAGNFCRGLQQSQATGKHEANGSGESG